MAGHGTKWACPHHCSAKEVQASRLGEEDHRAAAIRTASPFLGNPRRLLLITGKLLLGVSGAWVGVGLTALLKEQVGSWRTHPQWGGQDQPWQ